MFLAVKDAHSHDVLIDDEEEVPVLICQTVENNRFEAAFAIERAELTQPFAALLDGRTTAKATPTTDTGVVSVVGVDGPDASNVDTNVTGRTADGEIGAVTIRIYNTTPRGDVPTGRGVKEEDMVELARCYSNHPASARTGGSRAEQAQGGQESDSTAIAYSMRG